MSLSIDSKNIKLLCDPNTVILRQDFLDAWYKTGCLVAVGTVLETPESAASKEYIHKLYKILESLD